MSKPVKGIRYCIRLRILTEHLFGLHLKYNLERLKKLGLLRRVGPDKGGFWEIIE